MANDWLAVLMSGLGGAFTGAGVAQDRRRQQAMQDAAMARQAELDRMNAFTAQLNQRRELDELGFRPAAEFEQSVTRLPVLPGSGALGQAASAGFAQAQRGETIETPVGRFTQNRAETPRALRMRDVAMRREDARAELERRATEAREQRAFTERENRLNRENQRTRISERTAAHGSAPYRLSAPQMEKMVSIDQTLSLINAAKKPLEDAQQQGVRPSGRLGGVIPVPNWARLQFDIGGQPGRALVLLIGDLTSQVGNMRSGGAITPQEFERLEAFLPTPNDKPEVVSAKLSQFENTLKEIRAIRLRAYQGGYSQGPENPLVKALEEVTGLSLVMNARQPGGF